MNRVEVVLNATDGALVLGASLVVVGLVGLVLLALVGHVAMKPVRKTAFGQWAGDRTEARMDRFRVAFTARKGTKAGAP